MVSNKTGVLLQIYWLCPAAWKFRLILSNIY